MTKEKTNPSYVPCPQCMDPTFQVRQGEVCVDCGLPSRAARQSQFECLRAAAEVYRTQLRDRFAMSALPVAATIVNEDGATTTAAPDMFFAREAYRWADLMLQARLVEEEIDAPE